MDTIDRKKLEEFHSKIWAIIEEVGKVIVGQEKMLKAGVTCWLAEEHLLVGGYPGLGKTKFTKVLSKTLNAKFNIIQCTPDLLPSDIRGTTIFSQRDESYQFEEGPVFTNILLIDEINRANPKTKAALLDAMQDKEVTVNKITRPLPRPFMVLATMNPIDTEGVFELLEPEKDRIMMKINIDYPSFEEEVEIVKRQSILGEEKVNKIMELEELLEIQEFVKKIYVDPRMIDLAVSIVRETRTRALEKPDLVNEVKLGASPRGSMRIVEAARIQALFDKMDHVLPRHIYSVAPDTLRHRIILSFRIPKDEQEKVVDEIIKDIIHEVRGL